MLITNEREPFSAELKASFSDASRISVASAYFSPGAGELVGLYAHAGRAKVRLLLGRALQDGLPTQTKRYLLRLDEVARAQGGGVRIHASGFHSKLYVTEERAYVGSSNFTENGLGAWTEATLLADSQLRPVIEGEVERLWNGGIDFEAVVDQIKDIPVRRRGPLARTASVSGIDLSVTPGEVIRGLRVDLLDQSGNVPAKSGVNWGLGGGRARNRYEAYIRLPKSVLEDARIVFGSIAPETTATAYTHNGQTFEIKLQGRQSYGDETVVKQFSTRQNKTLGEWIVRDCLGITDGRAVTAEDLKAYGRSSLDIYRIGTDGSGRALVYLDFS